MRVLLVAALAAGVLVSSALGAAGDPKQKHTLAGSLDAQKPLLKLSDFPKGWKAKQAAQASGGSNLCKATRPDLSDLTEIGYATSPDFSLGQLQAVTQWARTYRSAKQAQTSYGRTVTIGLVSCLARQLKAASTAKATVSITGQFRLSLPRVAQEIDGFRVVAHTNVKAEKEQFDVYADVMVIRQGSTVTAVTMTGFVNPIDAATESRLARVIAGRLGAKPNAA